MHTRLDVKRHYVVRIKADEADGIVDPGEECDAGFNSTSPCCDPESELFFRTPLDIFPAISHNLSSLPISRPSHAHTR